MSTREKKTEQTAQSASEQQEIHQFQYMMYASNLERFKEAIPHDFLHEGFAPYLSRGMYSQLPSTCDFLTTWESESAANRFLLIFSFASSTCALFINNLDAYTRFQKEYGNLYSIMERLLMPERPQAVSGLETIYPLVPGQRRR